MGSRVLGSTTVSNFIKSDKDYFKELIRLGSLPVEEARTKVKNDRSYYWIDVVEGAETGIEEIMTYLIKFDLDKATQRLSNNGEELQERLTGYNTYLEKAAHKAYRAAFGGKKRRIIRWSKKFWRWFFPNPKKERKEKAKEQRWKQDHKDRAVTKRLEEKEKKIQWAENIPHLIAACKVISEHYPEEWVITQNINPIKKALQKKGTSETIEIIKAYEQQWVEHLEQSQTELESEKPESILSEQEPELQEFKMYSREKKRSIAERSTSISAGSHMSL